MTGAFQDDNALKSLAYGNAYRRETAAGGGGASRGWPALVRRLRNRLGLSQSALAGALGVTQAAVSRWENALDLPSVRVRRTMRDMLRSSDEARIERALRARLRYAPSPMSMVGPGARFLDFSASFASETGTEPAFLRGRTVYGQFGESVDATTEIWERSGIFGGDVALTLTVLALRDADGEAIYLRNFDTPHVLDGDRIVSVCESRRISRPVFDQHMARYGHSVFSLSYDEIAD